MSGMVGGLVAGTSATLLMEYASQAMWSRRSGESNERENELRSEMPTTVLVRKLAGAAGRQLDDEAAQKAGMVAHYAFGAAGGPATQALMATGAGPVKASMSVAVAMELAADQAANTALGLTAPSWKFPPVANMRGVVAHVAYGLALGLMLTAGRERS